MSFNEQWFEDLHAACEAVGVGVCGIYRFTHRATGHVYIGQSFDIAKRIKQHARESRKQGTKVSAWHKALFAAGGVSAFTIEVLERCARDSAELTERENRWLKYHDAGNSLLCYNTKGKSGPSPLGRVGSPVVYKRIALALKGRPRPQEVRDRISAAKLTPEGRARNSAANKGRKHTAHSRANMAKAQQRPDLLEANRARLAGIPLKADHVAKLSAFQKSIAHKTSKRMKGRVVSEESRAKTRATMTGVKHTPERRRNQSEARKRFLANNPNPFAGRKHSAESKAKMRASRLAYLSRIAA